MPQSPFRRNQPERTPAMPSMRPTGAPASTRRIGKSIAAKPEMYDGNKEKFLQWWRTLLFYLMGFENMPTDEQKIMIAISYMRGDNAAGRFADLYAQEVDFDTDAQTFDEFTKKVGETFLPKEIRREAERKLMALKQGPKDSVSDFFVRLKQLTLEAGYDTRVQGRLLIRLTRDGVRNEVVEYVERSNPDLCESENLAKWETALTHAEAILAEIADRKRCGGHTTFNKTWFGKRAEMTATTSSPPVPKTEVHPNQPGTFGAQGGVPMDISKARAEEKCFKCGKPWPCKDHFKPCAHQVRSFQYCGQKIEYTTAEELEAAITKAEEGFQKGE